MATRKLTPKTYASYIVKSNETKKADIVNLRNTVFKKYKNKPIKELNEIFDEAYKKRRVMQTIAQTTLISDVKKYSFYVDYEDFPKLIQNTTGFNYTMVKNLMADRILTTLAISNLAEKTRNSKNLAETILTRYQDEKINRSRISRAIDVVRTNGMDVSNKYILDFRFEQIRNKYYN